MPGNTEHREALERATALTSPQLYTAEIERQRGIYGHSIVVLPHDYGPFHRGKPEPSCYAYALGLTDKPDYLRLVAASAGPDGIQPASSAVISSLVRDGVFRRRRRAPKVGDLILYFADAQVQHAGTVIASSCRVRSKWGQAEVHEHELWEVPISYGTSAVVYVPAAAARVLQLIQTEAPE